MNLANLLANTARRVPHAPALLSGNRVLCSYRELAGAVAGRAAALVHDHGVGPGSRVAVYASNCPEYLEVLFAIWWAGGTAVPLSAMLHPREVQALVADCGAVVLIVSADLATSFSASLDGAVMVTVDELRPALGRAVRPATRLTEEAAWIFYTSGTTGTPKGAVLSNGNLLAMTTAHLADVEWLDERSGLLHLALMSHAGGLFALPYVARGARQLVPEAGSTEPAEAWTILRAQDRVSFFAPPVLLRRLVACADASSVDAARMGTVLVGAAPVLTSDLTAAVEVFGPRVWNGYGQGETPLTITALDPRRVAAAIAASDEEALRSVGFPRIATQVCVVGGDDVQLPEGEVGEVVVAGPTVMSGYLDRPEANAETLKGGWLHTGDLGRFDKGRLTLLDRSKDLVISGGANIYPREVEDVLMTHPSVGDVAVIGVADPEWGEQVVAVVVPAAGRRISAAELDSHCLERMARYKRPKRYHVVDELPRNGAGKVLKTALRATHTATDKEPMT